MTRKRLESLFFMFVLAFSVASTVCCSQSQAADKTYKIAWIGVSASDESTIVQRKFAEQYAKELGNVEIVSLDAQSDVQTQVNCVNSAVTQGCAAILICPLDPSALVPAFEDAMAHGVAVLCVGGDVSDEAARTAYVGPDETEAGRMAAALIVKQFPDGAKAVMIEGNSGESAQINRTQGFIDGIAGTNVTLLDHHTTEGWQPESAMTVMEDFLTKYPKIDAIYSHWDNGSVAIVEAIKAAGREKDGIFIVSVDGCYNGFDLVRDGDIYCTLMNSFDVIIRRAIDLGIEASNGAKLDSFNYTEIIPITTENVNSYDPGW